MTADPKTGIVYLVGAGPGDPNLLTLRAEKLLKTTDVVAYDALISPGILSLIPPNTELIPVGYRGYGSSKLQYRMHPEVIRKAKEGKSIVRLKSGDPWIFGRATQECEELKENNIPYEVVPGITAATAAAAYAGFPLTHRELSSDVILSSGHDLIGEFQNNSDWNSLAKVSGTLVIYMAGTKIRENCERLIRMGRAASSQAAYISQATRGSQKVITGTLENLAEKVGPIISKVPALIIVGETIGFRKEYLWKETQRFHNISVLLVRSRPGPSRLAEILKKEGAELIETPWIESKPIPENIQLENAFKNLNTYSNIVFSCKEGVSYFLEEVSRFGKDIRDFKNIPFLAIGEAVAKELTTKGILPKAVLSGHCLEAVQAEKQILAKGKNLVVTHLKGRPKLSGFFQELGLDAEFLPVYTIETMFPNFEPPGVDYVILPSSSSADLLFKSPWGEAYKETPILVLGPVTEKTAKNYGAMAIHKTINDDILEIPKLLYSLRETLV